MSVAQRISRPHVAVELDPLKRAVREHYDRMASERERWYGRNAYYHAWLNHEIGAIVTPGSRVLELGCALGDTLAAVKPQRGVGLDLSAEMIRRARRRHPDLVFEIADAENFRIDEKFDFVIVSDLVGELGDISAALERIQQVCHVDTLLVLSFHNPALEAVLRAAQRLGLAMAPYRQNWISPMDMTNLLGLADFEVNSQRLEFLVPKPIPGLANFANRHLAHIPGVRYFDLVNLLVARPIRPRPKPAPLSCTVLIPCRNEVGNIEAAVERTPEMGSHTEILFVDGASSDGTKQRIEEMIARYRGVRDIKLMLQVPQAAYDRVDDPDAPTRMLRLGKGDAVRKGFEAAEGDVLMILDADLTVPPEDLPRFFEAIATGKADFINGSRLIYPMEDRAMKFANYVGNKFFSMLFTWLLGQRIRDTLCGTKVLLKKDYRMIAEGRQYFGDFDPFGDFDLLFGASRLGLRLVEVPVRYRRRLAGVSKVRAFEHGWLLLGMSGIAFVKLKLPRLLRSRRTTRSSAADPPRVQSRR